MRKAFTTIEMIIMITLLAIMMVMIVPNFITYLDNSAKSEYSSAKRVIEIAAQKYVEDIGGFNNAPTEVLITEAVNTATFDLIEGAYISPKTIDILTKYANSGQAGSGIDGTNYSKKVCIDVNEKTVTYNIEVTSCP